MTKEDTRQGFRWWDLWLLVAASLAILALVVLIVTLLGFDVLGWAQQLAGV